MVPLAFFYTVFVSLWPTVSSFTPRVAFQGLNRITKLETSRFLAATIQPQTQTLLSPVLKNNDIIRNLIESDFPKVKYNDTVFTAVQKMNQFNKGGIVVVDDSEALSGIFTERDFVTKIIDTQSQSSEILIGSVMTPAEKLVVGRDDAKLSECRQLMLQHNIRHLPILSNDKKVLGVVSMREIIRALQQEDLSRASARFLGDTLAQIAQQAKEEANILALESGEVGKKQDILRSGFVMAAAVISAALLQGDWIHSHEYIAMVVTFILGYIGIIFETYFEFNKAGIALLMSTALWVIYAGSMATSGDHMPVEAYHMLQEKVSEVSEVVFFILGAMTIVEIVDSHQGFKVVTDKITASKKRVLLWTIGLM
jgi:CBS domain-containing protein